MMPGIKKEEVINALADAYDAETLKMMLDFRLDKRLFEIVGSAGLKTMLYNLLESADREGWNVKLITEAHRYNPGNEKLLLVYEKYGLTPKVNLQRAGLPGQGTAGAVANVRTAGLEKILDFTNLPIDIGLFRKGVSDAELRVCRVNLNGAAMGTGFLVGPSVVLTNYHVVQSVLEKRHAPGAVTCLFDYKIAANGSVNPGVSVPLAAAGPGILVSSPFTVEELAMKPDAGLPKPDQMDFALLQLARDIGNEGSPTRGYYSLPTQPYQFLADQPVIIAQHPRGEPMKLAIDSHSVIGTNVNETRVRYRANTEGGSSGSPVFDLQWNLVALHHYGDPALGHSAQYNQGVVQLQAIRAMIVAAGYGNLLA
jgi:hypothetical protein